MLERIENLLLGQQLCPAERAYTTIDTRDGLTVSRGWEITQGVRKQPSLVGGQ